MKTYLLSIFCGICIFGGQNGQEAEIVGKWRQLPYVSNKYMVFGQDKTVQLYDSSAFKNGNLRNKFTYKIRQDLKDTVLVFHMEKYGEVVDSLISKITFFSKDSMSILPYNREKGVVSKPTRFVRVKG